MSADFHYFGTAVHVQYTDMAKGPLYVVDIEGDWLWDAYLKAFPPGTNEIYRERTEHDCSCCKNFIRNIGAVVSIKNGKLVTVWDDYASLPYPYNIVSQRMAGVIRQKPIKDIFLSKEGGYGAEYTLELVDGKAKRWSHFHGPVSGKHKHPSPTEGKGVARARVQVFERGLTTLNPAHIDDILDLINQGNLYRGDEHKPALQAFQKLQRGYAAAKNRSAYIWSHYAEPGAQLRNTVIGSLLIDLAEGKDLEHAVKSFEAKVAPANYKRPKALITPHMIVDALKTATELGYETAFERRHATLNDITINNVLYADRAVKPAATSMGKLRDTLLQEATMATPDFSKVATINIDQFLGSILPKAKSIHALLENKHVPNLMSLTTAVHPDAKHIFQWPNSFGWAYNGNMTDMGLKQKVAQAGGKITAPFRISLGWYNYDDLDLHVHSPRSHIYFGYKKGTCGGQLDVDMNVSKTTRSAVENIYWDKYPDGTYIVKVDRYTMRESIDVGFEVEIEIDGTIRKFFSKTSVTKRVCSLTIHKGKVVDIDVAAGIESTSAPQEIWNLKTQTLVPVSAIMHSPNYWDGNKVGNKHHFFLLSGCKNPDPVRGFFNEFLPSSLQPHRKVFEVLADKTKAPYAEHQLSGLGFSSTIRNQLGVVVNDGSRNTPYNITF